MLAGRLDNQGDVAKSSSLFRLFLALAFTYALGCTSPKAAAVVGDDEIVEDLDGSPGAAGDAQADSVAIDTPVADAAADVLAAEVTAVDVDGASDQSTSDSADIEDDQPGVDASGADAVDSADGTDADADAGQDMAEADLTADSGSDSIVEVAEIDIGSGEVDAAVDTDTAVDADAVADADVVADADAVVDTGPVIDPPPVDSWKAPPGVVSYGYTSCPADSSLPPMFKEVAVDSGVFLDRPQIWPDGTDYSGQEVSEGGGTTVEDFNGDGRLDIYLVVTTGEDLLYLADPKIPWKYIEYVVPVTTTEDTGATAVDFDGDGDQDLFIGGDGVHALRNDGPDAVLGVKFTDITSELGLDATAGLPLMQIVAGDIDRNGWVDLVLVSNKFEKPPPFVPSFPFKTHDNIVLLNNGGKFVDQGVVFPIPMTVPAYMGSLVDIDDDGDLDFYAVNDFAEFYTPNQLLRNDTAGPGTPLIFTNISSMSGADVVGSGMGTAIGDYDLDGLMDLFVSGHIQQNFLIQNKGMLAGMWSFADTSTDGPFNAMGNNFVSWGTQFSDIENDGWLDLALANGYLKGNVAGGEGINNNPVLQHNSFFHNEGNGKFTDVTFITGFDDKAPSRSLTRGDLDRDGYVDLLVGSTYGQQRVYRSGCGTNNWLHVRLKGKPGNVTGIGARLWAKVGSVTYVRDIESGSTGLWGSSEQAADFGLGSAMLVDQLKIRWPSGKLQFIQNIPTRRRLVITEP